jgi:adenylate cyclase
MNNSPSTWIAPGLARAAQRIERPLRLGTGLILFAYATSHLVNHAFGIRSIEAMGVASFFLLKPWQTPVGLLALHTSFFTHGMLGLFALYRRRHLRMPASEAWQLALGLAIPLLLIPHAAPIRIGQSVYGLEFGYARVIYHFWHFASDWSLPRQYLLLLVVWTHGCIGLRAWLSSKPWYRRVSTPLASLALLVPVLALLGFTNAGFDARETAQRDPDTAAAFDIALPGPQAAANLASAYRITNTLAYAYLGLLVGTIGLRTWRGWHVRRFRAVRITYPSDRVVTVPLGFSLLEASRWAGIPHASVCGGRARCSTCRVRVIHGAEHLLPPTPAERRTLDRIGGPRDVRLACQVRPQADISIEPLVRASTNAAREVMRFGAAIEGGTEMEIAALFVDLRESTRLAAGRLPYDALFLFDRYIQVVTTAVRRNDGHVTSIAGDGVMSMFGVKGSGESAARDAFSAAAQLWQGVETLNHELADELQVPLRIGIGLHVGTAVVGMISDDGVGSLQFLGDTGNLAAKLEAETKRHHCILIASAQAAAQIAPDQMGFAPSAVAVPGKEDDVHVVMFRTRGELEGFLRPPAATGG